MNSNSDENKNLSNDVNFDSKNIVRRDNKELFTRVEGAETRAKKAAEERARVERAKRRFAKRAENDTKRRARKIASAQRRAHLKAVLWEGKHKRRTIIVAIIVLAAAAAYPVYLGGSTLIKNIVASVEEKKEQKENERIKTLPENYANIIMLELAKRYRENGFDAGEAYFEEELDKIEDNDGLIAKLYLSHATVIENEFQGSRIDEAISSAHKSEEITHSAESASKLYNLYLLKGDNINAQKYFNLYKERSGESDGGIG